jgi:hypothetical protein
MPAPSTNTDGSFARIAARWPQVARALEAAPAVVVERAGTPPRLTVDGIQLASAYDAEAEATLQARSIEAVAREATVFGLGLGHLPRALLARPALERLRVVLLAPGADRAALEHEAGGAWLDDPRLTLALAWEDETPRPPFAVVPSALALAAPAAFPLRDALVIGLNRAFSAAPWQAQQAELALRIDAHATAFAGDRDIATLFGSAVGQTVLVAGAGPTLASGLAWLAARRVRTPAIAATAALRPFAHAGLAPDVAVALDPSSDLLSHLEHLEPAWLAAIALAHAPIVTPELMGAWPGPRYVFHPERPLYDAISARAPRGRLYAEGTVAHPAVDLAVRMGASHVVLAGLDCAYVGGRTHAPGAPRDASVGEHRGARLALENGRGELVWSDMNLVGYLRATEAFIASHPEVRISVTSLDGARIRGTTLVEAP